MEFKDNIPIYIQICNMIKKSIAKESIKSGDKLMSAREMAIEIKVNPNTVVRAFSELEKEGITFTKRGMGTYICEDPSIQEKIRKELAENIIGELMEELVDIGLTQEEIKKLVEERTKK